MKTDIKLVLSTICLLATSSILVSCNAKNDADDQMDQTEQADHAEDHSGHDHADSTESGLEGLSLNDGKKWMMDDHTRSSFSTMADSFLALNHATMDTDALKQVGTDLRQDINGLIQGCTMTGESHNQLHVLLTGYIASVDALAASGQIEDAIKVKGFLEEYAEYFE
ncbi:MAG: hypothetical protein JKX70_02535 [Phycisphaerales bacterium]|nr:hypothetical protein [Phycisphaerales bacterium]